MARSACTRSATIRALLIIILFLPDGLWSLTEKYRASKARTAAGRQAAE